ncbi:MAG: SusC/RagA family TonB-linked outer membrane protein [Paludibacteraceae bacterium]|nr:SusC/RagA family TonB-linked outer membrane protein [Paludibacteraceae bacterium]
MKREEQSLKRGFSLGLRTLMVALLLVISFSAFAQTKVTGVIVDEFDEPMIGASVRIQGTSVGTITDFDGNFELNVTSSKDVLEFFYMGYKTQTSEVGGQTAFRIKLQPDNKVLEEVVVTAMGIERKAKSLTYATQSVSGAELTKAKDSHIANSLQGKMAGLVITPNSSGAGGGASKITLRGQTSLLGNNDALIVVDGIPISNGASGQSSVGDAVYSGSRDGGDPLSNYNADDIANITVLKGANAAALYGSKANNGVVLITTKSGREGAVRVDISSNTTFETPLVLPKFQNTYGSVISGDRETGYETSEYSWSHKKLSEYTPEEVALYKAYIPYFTTEPRDNLKEYFNLGMNFTNTIAINGGSENARSYFSYGNTTANGVMENNTFSRHNLMFKQNFILFNKYLKLDFSANYINQKMENVPMSGEARNPLYSLYKVGRDVDMRYFKANYKRVAQTTDDITLGSVQYKRLLGQDIQNWPWAGENYNNPYWLAEKTYSSRSINRLILSGTANVKIIDGLNFQLRYSRDQTFDKNEDQRYATIRFKTKESSSNWLSQSQSAETFADAIFTFAKEAGPIDINATVGGSYNKSEWWSSNMGSTADTAGMINYFYFSDPGGYFRTGNVATGLYGIYGTSLGAGESWGDDWNAAVFGTAQVGLWDKAFVDFSYRHDWSKAFSQFKGQTYTVKDAKGEVVKDANGNPVVKNAKTSFGYWSIGANLLLKDLFNITNKKINIMKLRASYSEVGNSIPATLYGSYTYNAVTGTYSGQAYSFDNPQPETTTSIEVGYDMALFNNAFDFDITYYYSTMVNQFLSVGTVSGMSKPINTGKIRNTGIEFTANYNWNITKDFSWRTGLNFSYNDNLILSTYNDGTEYTMGWDIGGFLIKFKPGGSYGDLYVRDYDRDENGSIITSSLVGAGVSKYAGNSMAPFYYGWNNTFNYKGFSFYFLLDGKIGGKVISYTQAKLDAWGVSEASGVDRNGFIELPDGQLIDVETFYKKTGNVPMSNYVYDASNLRLRELSVGYTFKDLLGASKNLSLSFVARNLCFLYKSCPVDPDISASTSNGMGGIDVFAMPTSRSYGLNIKVTF